MNITNTTQMGIQLSLDQLGPQQAVNDTHFGPCIELQAGTTMALPEMETTEEGTNGTALVWLKRMTAATVVKLGTDTDHLQIDHSGSITLFQDNEPLGDSFQGTPSRSMGEDWHHLAWVRKGDIHTFYLDGTLLETRAMATDVPWPAIVKNLTVTTGEARFSYFDYYFRALEATEVIASKVGQESNLTTFVDQYPIDFALAHKAGDRWENLADHTLVIEDVSGDERIRQQLTITNVSEEKITLLAQQDGTATKDDHHLELRLRNGIFNSPGTYPVFKDFESDELQTPPGWAIARSDTQNPEDGSWSIYFLRTAPLDLEPGETLSFPFEYRTADGTLGGRSTRVALYFKTMQFEDGEAIAGIREKQVDILNLSANNSLLQRVNEEVTVANDKVDQLEQKTTSELDGLGDLFDSLFTNDDKLEKRDGTSVDNPIKKAESNAISQAATDAQTKADAARSEAISQAATDAQTKADAAETAAIARAETYAKEQASGANETGYKTDQGKNNGRIKDLPALTKDSIKSLFGGVLSALGTLASNIKAVDDEVDTRAEAQAITDDMLERSFPIIALVSTPQGLVCNDAGTSLEFKLINTSNARVTFTDNAEFRFIIPIGNTTDALAASATAAGTPGTLLEKETETANSQVFTWRPTTSNYINARHSRDVTISNITPNALVGPVTIYIEYQGVEGFPSGKLSVTISKISRDIAQLVGGENVGIGTSAPDAKLELIGSKKPVPFKILSSTTENGFTIDAEAGQGLISLVAGAEINDSGNGYNFIGTRGASRIAMHDGSLHFFTSDETSGTAGESVDGLKLGDEKMIITSAGSVGIGTTSPNNKLDVRGQLGIKNNDGERNWIQWWTDDNSDHPAQIWDNDRDMRFGTWNSWSGKAAWSEKMRIKGNGNVGIGTTSPTQKLDIPNATIRSSRIILEGNPGTGSRDWGKSIIEGRIWSANSNIHLSPPSGRSVIINTSYRDAGGDGGTSGLLVSGNVGIGTTNPKIHLAIGDNDTGLQQQGDGKLGFYTDNAERLRIDKIGNVGIGTNSPSDRLHVHGTLRLSTSDRWAKMYTQSYSHKTQLVFQLDRHRSTSNRKRTYMIWDGDNNLDYSSDISLKTNIKDEENILERLLKLKVKNYQWKDEEGEDPVKTGFIAQEVQPVFPNLVGSVTDPETGETSLTLKYTGFGVLAVGAIKELKAEVDALRKEIKALAKKVGTK